MLAVAIFGTGFGLWAARKQVKKRQQKSREEFITSYRWPAGLKEKLQTAQPGLDASEIDRVFRALTQFFQAYLRSGCQPVAMPVRSADWLWHEFILHTQDYENFCKKAFGKFLHHQPAIKQENSEKAANPSLRRTWIQCCRIEGIDPYKPTRLPLLFVVDELLKVPDGITYDVKVMARLAESSHVSSGGTCHGESGRSGWWRRGRKLWWRRLQRKLSIQAMNLGTVLSGW